MQTAAHLSIVRTSSRLSQVSMAQRYQANDGGSPFNFPTENKGRPVSIDPAQVQQLKAEGMGPSQIAKQLGIASVWPEHGESHGYAAMVPSAGPIEK